MRVHVGGSRAGRAGRVVTLLVVLGTAGAGLIGAPAAAAAAARVKVSAPAVSSVSANRGPDAGGTRVRVSGSSFVRVSRVTFGGVAGSSVHVLSKTSLLVTTPAHVPGTVDVRVTSSTGTSRVTSKDRFGFAEAPTRWSATMVAPSHYRPTSVSCASPSLCVAVDSFGSAFVHGDSGWTAPAKVEITGSLTSTALAAISCVPGTSWCLAVGDGGRADAYDGTNWKPKPVPGSPDLTGVSCASTTFCLAIGAERANEVYAFDGNAWAGVKASFDTQPFTSVSCGSTELCAFGSRSDSIDVYGANSGWAAPVAVGGAFSTRVDVLSCAAGTTFCMEIDDAGWARTSADGLTWSPPTLSLGHATSLSCVSSTFCVAVAGADTRIYSGSWGSFDSTAWSDSVSCASTTTCESITYDGYSARYAGGIWIANGSPFDGPRYLAGFSCGSATFCLAAENTGATFEGTGATWGAGAKLEIADASVSCAGSNFCVAVDSNGGGIHVLRGSSWSAVSLRNAPASPANTAVSCPTSRFCFAATHGAVTMFDGDGWTPWGDIDGSTGITHLACAGPSLCAATDDAGRALIWNGRTWSAPTYMDGSRDLTAVSCAGRACLVTDGRGYAIRFDGHGWSSPQRVTDGRGLIAVSCLPTGICYAVADREVLSIIGGWHHAQAVRFAGDPIAVACVTGLRCYVADLSGEISTGS